MAPRSKYVPLAVQEKALLTYFPESKVTRVQDHTITWTHTLTPTVMSPGYEVKIHYTRKDGPRVYVTDPKPLELAKGKDKLPHVYSTPEQRLCLYYPDKTEWNDGKLFVHTLVPWTSEWLFHYEIWVGTGVWFGGGVDHENSAEQ